MLSTLLLTFAAAVPTSANLIVYPLITAESDLGFHAELFEISAPIKPHYHQIQRQIFVVVEGELDVVCDEQDPVQLKKGDWIVVNPGSVHSLFPKTEARFFSISLPGRSYPEDVYSDFTPPSVEWSMLSKTGPLSVMPSIYEQTKIDLGSYAVYEIVNGEQTQNEWSLAVLDIQDSPKHFHKIEREIFIPVEGSLDLELNGARYAIGLGEPVEVVPENVHKLRSENGWPVRLLCFSFPAFNPTDMYLLDD